MLFDSFDVFLGNISCKEMGKKLSDLIKVGDHIRYCAILIAPNTPLTRDISHLATAVVFASTHSLIRTRDIPSTAPKVTNLKQLEAAKVGNFRTVTGLVGKTALTAREKQLMAEVEAGGKGKNDMEIDSDDEVEGPSPEELRAIRQQLSQQAEARKTLKQIIDRQTEVNRRHLMGSVAQ